MIDLLNRWVLWFESSRWFGGSTPTIVIVSSIAVGAILGILGGLGSAINGVDRHDRSLGELSLLHRSSWSALYLLLIVVSAPLGLFIGVFATSALTVILWNHYILLSGSLVVITCFAFGLHTHRAKRSNLVVVSP